MRVHIATDHAGLETSQYLIEQLTAAGYDMIDHGPQEYDPLDDYPSFCINAALAVKRDRDQGLDSLGKEFAPHWPGITILPLLPANTIMRRSLRLVVVSTAMKKH